MDLKQLEDLIAQKVDQARHSTLVHLTLSQALNALKTGAHEEGQRLITEAEALDAELRNLLHLGPMPLKQTSAELVGALAQHFVTPDALSAFKQTLELHVSEWIDELERRARNTVEPLLMAHLAELERRFPVAAGVLHEVGTELANALPMPEPTNDAATPDAPPVPALRTPEPTDSAVPAMRVFAAQQPAGAPEPDHFPTLAEYSAMGFMPDTYEHQKAAWEAEKNPPPADVAPTEAVEPTPNPQENGPSDSATSAGSESA